MNNLIEIKRDIVSDETGLILIRSGSKYPLNKLCKWIADGKFTYEQLLNATEDMGVVSSAYFYKETDNVLKFSPKNIKIQTRDMMVEIEEKAIKIASEIKKCSFWTFSHSMRVSMFATAIAIQLELSDEDIHTICEGALLHDIGKTKIPSKILNKKEALTEEEFKIMRMHTYYGYEILTQKGFGYKISQFALNHHERRSGNGYYGFKLYSTLVEIVSLADTLDAMCAVRPYSKGRTLNEAFEILSEENAEQNLFTDMVLTAAKKALCSELVIA